jgi:putative holliday junction resolvase
LPVDNDDMKQKEQANGVLDADRRSGSVAMIRGRVIGLDLGSRRIGVAVSDSAGMLASPRTTVVRTGDPDRDRRSLTALAVEEEATVVVVGLPLSLDGSKGAAAIAAESEAEALGHMLRPLGIEVELFDERLTTVTAQRSLQSGGKGSRARRKVIDRSAAAVMLQAWLETQKGQE